MRTTHGAQLFGTAIAAVALAASLAGCGGATDASGSSSASNAPASASDSASSARAPLPSQNETASSATQSSASSAAASSLDVSANSSTDSPSQEPSTAEVEEPQAATLAIASGDTVLHATLEDNEATAALVAMLANGPISLDLHEYGGFEKIGTLPQALPASDAQVTTQPGDIVLYQGNQLSFFYGTNSWSYTRIGHIEGASGEQLLEALGGSANSTVELSLA